MKDRIDFNSQFSMDLGAYLKGTDLSSWFRYYFILKEVIAIAPKNVLEIGAGNEVVKNCLLGSVESYRVLDINSKLKPDILSDLREYKPELKEKFDCLICSEVLEHMLFENLENNLVNIYKYLKKGGRAVITIPHRRARVMIVTPLSYQKPLIIELPFWAKSSFKSFYDQVLRGQVYIDAHHCWEIGAGKIKKENVEEIFKKSGFLINKSKKLLHVDLWVLDKK